MDYDDHTNGPHKPRGKNGEGFIAMARINPEDAVPPPPEKLGKPL